MDNDLALALIDVLIDKAWKSGSGALGLLAHLESLKDGAVEEAAAGHRWAALILEEAAELAVDAGLIPAVGEARESWYDQAMREDWENSREYRLDMAEMEWAARQSCLSVIAKLEAKASAVVADAEAEAIEAKVSGFRLLPPARIEAALLAARIRKNLDMEDWRVRARGLPNYTPHRIAGWLQSQELGL